MRIEDLITKEYVILLKAIRDNGGVECEEYPDIYIAPEGIYNNKLAAMDYRFTRMICGRCPVKSQCADYAIAAVEPWGMWGGLTPRQIQKEHAKRYGAKGRGRPRLDLTVVPYGERQGQAEESRSESDIRPMQLPLSESFDEPTGTTEQVLAWGEDWDSDTPLY